MLEDREFQDFAEYWNKSELYMCYKGETWEEQGMEAITNHSLDTF